MLELVMTPKEALRLKELLQEVRGNQSIRAFTKELGIGYASWTAWEARNAAPTFENLELIAKIIGWSVIELIAYIKTGQKDNPPYSVEDLLKYGKTLPLEDRQLLAKRLLEDE
ncbi:helix-turn-helix transcriptional regulator (plasmid) [Synechocystis sp. B12]|nr:helix-turn-helix transcriptional regulator [Synechocystis sp. B12]